MKYFFLNYFSNDAQWEFDARYERRFCRVLVGHEVIAEHLGGYGQGVDLGTGPHRGAVHRQAL